MATLTSIKNKYLTVSDGDALGVTTNTENISALSFRLAGADSLSVFNLVDGFADDYIDAAGVDASASTNETRDATGNYYTGSASGTISAFTSTGAATWTAPTTGDAEVLVVAGGGGGANGYYGGAGGAGGVVHASAYPVTASVVYDLSVGAGGSGGNPQAGTNSVFNVNGEGANTTVLTANGGGRGGGGGQPAGGGSGGSGGGADNDSSSGGSSNQPASFGTPQVAIGYGNAGGGVGGNSGAGGGGANAVGQGSNGNTGGNGGAGKLFETFVAYGTTSANAASGGSNGGYFGGGGGGAAYNSPPAGHSAGAGGVGGGGKGQGQTSDSAAGLANTGGGGGAQSVQGSGGGGRPGGSGVVLIKSADVYLNMTLQSNVFTAQADPDTARVILDELTSNGATTINTDIKAYASRDNGTTFTQMTLANQGYSNTNAGIDGYTKLMLHCDGSNGGTTFTDSSFSGHDVTASGNGVTDTAIKKFGTASYECPATGDFLSIADSDDWNFGSGDFTIDAWLYRTGTSSYQTILQHKTDNSNYWQWRYFGSGGNITFAVTGSGSFTVSFGCTDATFPVNTWVHHEMVRDGNSWKLFQDGTQTGSTQTQAAAIPDMTGNLIWQGDSSLGQPFIGYMDEMRISKGIARHTSNFTVPWDEYTQSRRILSGSADISGQPAGSNMKYKIETLNQAITKQTRIYAASMAWA